MVVDVNEFFERTSMMQGMFFVYCILLNVADFQYTRYLCLDNLLTLVS